MNENPCWVPERINHGNVPVGVDINRALHISAVNKNTRKTGKTLMEINE